MRVQLGAVALLALALGVGASAQRQSESQSAGSKQKGDQRARAGDNPVRVVGCLSGADKIGLILTADPGDLTSGVATQMSGATRSVTYQLVGGDRAALAKLMGQRVEIAGTTPDDPAATQKMQSTEEHSTKGSGTKPKVETTEKLHMEVRKLNVASVKSVPGDCPAAK